jgi:hypothetical protein
MHDVAGAQCSVPQKAASGRNRNDSTIGRGREDIVRMPGLQGFYLVGDGLVRTDENGLYEGWMFNGQKLFSQIIAGRLAAVIDMYQLFRHLATKQPGNGLLQRQELYAQHQEQKYRYDLFCRQILAKIQKLSGPSTT